MGGGGKSLSQRSGVSLFGFNDAGCIHGPGGNGFAVVAKVLQVLDGNGFCLQFQYGSGLICKFRDDLSGKPGPGLPNKAVGKFPGADTVVAPV